MKKTTITQNCKHVPEQVEQIQRGVTDIGDFYALRCSFNGTQILFSLAYYKCEVLSVFQGFFNQQSANEDLIRYYGSWENVYTRCFERKFNYQIIAQGSSKLIQIPYRINELGNKSVEYQKFPLNQIQITANLQIEKLKEIISRKDEQKMKHISQLNNLNRKIQRKQLEVDQIKSELDEMDKLCNQAGIPLFIKTKDLQMIQRGNDPNQIRFMPPKFDAKQAYVVLRNQISQQKPFILKINFQPIMRTQNHAIGIVDGSSIKDIPNAELKVVYEFKGQMIFGIKNRVPCEDMRIMNYTQIQMKVDFKTDLVEFRRGNQKFASAHLSSLRGKTLRPFVKIGQQGIRYHLSISS